MADDAKSFQDLLDAAPLTPKSDTVSLVGVLSRSSEAGKFVLTMSDGQATSFDVDAVKGHAVLAGAVGQTIVRVDLDPAKVPDTAKANPDVISRKPVWADGTLFNFDHTAIWDTTGTIHDFSVPGVTDPITLPGGGNTPDPAPFVAMQARTLHTVPQLDNTGFFDHSGLLDITGFMQDQTGTGIVDPIDVGNTPDTPFLMATPHHASAAQIAAMQGGATPAGAAVAPFLFQTLPQFDHTAPLLDRPKRPTEDGTFGAHRDF